MIFFTYQFLREFENFGKVLSDRYVRKARFLPDLAHSVANFGFRKLKKTVAIARHRFPAYADRLMVILHENFGSASKLPGVTPILLTGFLGMMTLVGWSQTIPNPSFEDAAVPAGALFLDPQTPSYPELIPELKWAFGMLCGICVKGTAYAEQILSRGWQAGGLSSGGSIQSFTSFVALADLV